MGEPIAEVGYLAGLCGFDDPDWLKVLVDADGKLIIEVDTSALPSGAATSAHQLTMITALQSLQNLVGALHDVGLDELDIQFAGQAVDVEVKQQTPADLVVAQHQYDGSTWRKSNLLFGYNGTWDENLGGTAGAAAYSANTATIPSGEAWVLQGISIRNTSRAITSLTVYLWMSSSGLIVMNDLRPAARYAPCFATGQFVLTAGDAAFVDGQGCTAGDTIQAGAVGYKMDLAM